MNQPKRIGIVGCGQIGAGVAAAAAVSGLEVAVVTRGASSRDRAWAQVERALTQMASGDTGGEPVLEHARDRIELVTDVGALRRVDAVVEAIPEELEAKRQLLTALDAVLDDDTMIASTTSSIPILTLASTTRLPERVVGMHFMNPVSRVRLVEIVGSLVTNEATLDTARSLAESLGRVVVHAPDRPGFIVSALLIPYLLSAIRMHEQGVAEASDIDRAVVEGLRHPLGPLALCDLIGLDVVLATAEAIHRESGDPALVPPFLLRRLVEAGHLGRKSGQGFYTYGESR